MQTMLIAFELLIAVALIVFVLLQRSEGGALGMGGGGNMGGLFSPRGAADTLTRTTAILGALFFIVCLALNLLALHVRDEKSILDAPISATTAAAPVKPAQPLPLPAGPQVPKPQ